MSVIEIRPNRKVYVDIKEKTWPTTTSASGSNDDCTATATTSSSEYSSCGDSSSIMEEVVVLLIHGSCAHSGQWDEQVHWLLNQQQQPQIGLLRIVRYDYFGCGQSMKPIPTQPPNYSNSTKNDDNNINNIYSAIEHYDDLLAIYERCCCIDRKQKVWIMAHSFGCSMAVRLAAENRKSDHNIIEKLILISPVSLVGDDVETNNLPWIFHLPTWMLSWIQPILTEGFIKSAFHPNTINNQPDLIESERTKSNSNPPYMFQSFYLSMVDYYLTSQTNEEARSNWFEILSSSSSSNNNQINTLIICGEDDQIIPSQLDNSRHLGEKLSSSTTTKTKISVIDNASHQVMQEQPNVVNALLASYLFDDPKIVHAPSP